MVGCKINSIEMPLVTKLQDGNIVEIITSELEMLQKIRRMEQVDKLSEELMEIPNMIRVIK